ncbi:MAG: hypothetical protein JW750_06710 [Anaerolineaceae bacterium]|nr:hypothetical protein [Anaerolineaceae bacterium]
MTRVSINGDEYWIDDRPTYPGRFVQGKKIEGLLFNVRAVQATFDDANPQTRSHWAYPDTGKWDAQRNVDEFCAALPAWKAHGVLAFTINFQGGGPLYSPEIYQHYDNNAFDSSGSLKDDYAKRIRQVLQTADDLGMVVIVGLFYWAQTAKMSTESVWNAARNALSFLRATAHQNFLIEIANENNPAYHHEILLPQNVHRMIDVLRESFPEMLFSSSLGGMDASRQSGLPSPALVASSDYVLLHGNENLPESLAAGIDIVRSMPAYRKHPKPLMINEDSPGIPNLETAWQRHVSWGYYDQGYGGADAYGGDRYMDYRSRPRETSVEALSGFQTPPIHWGINTSEKQAFYNRVAQLTGAAD